MKRLLFLCLLGALLVGCTELPTSETHQVVWIQSTANNQTITLPSGVTNATLLIRHHGVTVQGAGVGLTVLRADGTSSGAIMFPYPVTTPDGLPISDFHLRDLTIDASAASLVTVLGSSHLSGPLLYEMDNVEVVGTSPSELAFGMGDVVVDFQNVAHRGGGKAFSFNGTSGTVDEVEIRGGLSGFIVAQTTNPTTVEVSNADVRLDYWAGPATDSLVPTAFAATYVDSLNTGTGRALYDVIRVLTPTSTPGLFDRVEASDGRWAQVEGVGVVPELGPWHLPNSWIETDAPASSVVTQAYNVVLGRVMGITSTRLTVTNWRTPRGEAAPTPSVVSGIRVDIRRHALYGGVRDVDVGGVHFTAPTINSVIRDSYFRGGFSDQVTLRGTDNSAIRVVVELGQDMGYTLDGTGALMEDCTARLNGVDGVYVVANSDPSIYGLRADLNGVLWVGLSPPAGIGYGVKVGGGTPDIQGLWGFGNLAGLLAP
jgi:hypothetical protein